MLMLVILGLFKNNINRNLLVALEIIIRNNLTGVR